MKSVTCASWKGGTGKSDLTAASAIALSNMGYTVLLVDLDSNMTMSRIFKKEDSDHTSRDLLNGEKIIPQNTIFENIDIIPSDVRISKMANLSERELSHKLKKMDLEKYDFIFFDPPGTMNGLTRNAMKAADSIIVTGMFSSIDLRCIPLIMEEIEMMELTETDIFVQMTNSQPDKNEPGIHEKYYEEYGDFIANPPISSMKSMKRLTADISSYKLRGSQKKQIDDFVKNVIISNEA